MLCLLASEGCDVQAVSRKQQIGNERLTWHQSDLQQFHGDGMDVDAVFSCGPLDHFARWFDNSRIVTKRVIAFGSTSVLVKQTSEDSQERELAGRLSTAEQLLFAAGSKRQIPVTILRPTLVWGAGMDKSLSRIASLVSRTGFFVLPSSATGQRQPVHVDDLAHAAMAVVACTSSHARSYNLGGGEVLTYRQMVHRVVTALPHPARLWIVPSALFTLMLAAVQRLGYLRSLGAAAVKRMEQDLAFDISDAQRDFGYAPRGFSPTPAELGLDQ